VGQTKRKLKTRIKEDMSDMKKKTSDSWSVMSQHRMNHGHEIDWSNIQILDYSFYKKSISEIIFIKKQINKQTDTEKPDAYLSVMNIPILS